MGREEVRRIDRAGPRSAWPPPTTRSADAGELGVDPARVAVVAGSGVGGLTTLEEEVGVHLERGPKRVSPFLVPMMMANATAGLVSMQHGFTGPSLCVPPPAPPAPTPSARACG